MSDGPWWGSDPAEQPIPLTASGGEEQQPLAIAEEARRIVLESQAAISREETDPGLPLWTPVASPRPEGQSLWTVPIGRWAVALLVVGCIATFTAGWLQGVPGGPGLSTGVMGVTPAQPFMSSIAQDQATALGVKQ